MLLRAPIRMDLHAADLAAALAACLLPPDGGQTADRLRAFWPQGRRTLVALNVRSGLDLFLQAVALPVGSEVVASAVTHPDMIAILQNHGLKVLPADLDVAAAAPRFETLLGAIGPGTKAVMVAHLFGARAPMDPIAALCRERGLLLIEDCAQCYDGEYFGHPEADVSLFSFGPLKTATALGGALLCVRDGALHGRMQAILDAYPLQGRREFARRIVKYGLFHWILSSRLIYGGLYRFLERAGYPAAEVMRSWAHSFPGPPDPGSLRKRPSPVLLALLVRRLKAGLGRLQARTRAGQTLAVRIPAARRPGAGAIEPTFWIFPVLADDPEGALERLHAAGFQGMRGLSNLEAVEAPADRPELDPRGAKRMIAHSLLIPAYPELSDDELDRIAAVLSGR
jgi:perosamine synthetase